MNKKTTEQIDHIVDLAYYGEKHFLKGCYEHRKDWLRNAIKELLTFREGDL